MSFLKTLKPEMVLMALLQTQFQLEYTYLEMHNVRTLGKIAYHDSMFLVPCEMRQETSRDTSVLSSITNKQTNKKKWGDR